MTKGLWPSVDHSLLSPSGRMSKRARKAANDRETKRLFGPNGLAYPGLPPQPPKRDAMLRVAKELRELAARGFHPKRHTKEADEPTMSR